MMAQLEAGLYLAGLVKKVGWWVGRLVVCTSGLMYLITQVPSSPGGLVGGTQIGLLAAQDPRTGMVYSVRLQNWEDRIE